MRNHYGVGYEVVACKAAVIQALRFKFRLSTTAIAALTDSRPQDVSTLTIGAHSTKPWWNRRHQAEAIEAARELIRGGLK